MENTITLKDLPSLKVAYEKAVKEGLKSFTFNSGVLLTAYAKYLIEYLETK